MIAVTIKQRMDAIPEVDLEISRSRYNPGVDQMRAFPKVRLHYLIVQHDIVVGALFGEKRFDRAGLRYAIELIEKPKVLLHQQKPLRIDIVMLDHRREPPPEVYKTSLRIFSKIIPRRWFGDKRHPVSARLDLLKHLRQGDDVNMVIGAVEKPFQISGMQ